MTLYDIFKFTNMACDCEVDITRPSKGIIYHIFRLYPRDDVIDFVYTNKQGLVNKKYSTAGRRNAVLFDLLAIKDGDTKAVKKYIEKYGFFLPLDPNGNNSIESECLFVLINRLQATVSLMLTLSKKKMNYEQVLALTMYLLLSPQTKIGLPPYENEPFCTYEHEMGYYWHNTISISERVFRAENGEHIFDGGYFIEDSVRPPATLLIEDEYFEAMGCGDYDLTTMLTTMKAKIIYLFRNATTVSPHCRLAIDFIYHFYKDFGELQDWNHNGELVFTESNPSTFERFKNDEQLKDGLLKLAKHTLKSEIEGNLGGIVPSYDTELMMPSWNVDYLLSGLYYSVFSMRPNIEINAVCANPRCGEPFQPTSANKKFCSSKCANAAAQSNYRRRKREQ